MEFNKINKNLIVDQLGNELQSLKKEISDLRKQGADPSIAEYKLSSVPSKIQYLRIENNDNMVGYIRSIYDDVRKELLEAEEDFQKYKEELKEFELVPEKSTENSSEKSAINVAKFDKKEPVAETIAETFKKEDNLSKIKELIDNCENLINNKKIGDAKQLYLEIHSIYNNLSNEDKEKVKPECVTIYTKLKSS